MKPRRTIALSLLAAVALLTAGCTSASLGGAVTAATANAESANQKWTHATDWGTFVLDPRIAAKEQNGATMNVLLSVDSQTIPIYSDTFKKVFPTALEDSSKKDGIPLKGTFVGPVESNVAEQIDQIKSAVAANQVDCLSVAAAGNLALTPVIDQLVAQGIPVFTLSADVAGSHRFSTYQVDYTLEGQALAQATASYFQERDIPLKTVMMTSGEGSATWAQARMKAYSEELKNLVPGVSFLNDPSTALTTGWSPAEVYAGVRAYLAGNPDVSVVYQTDTGASSVLKVLSDLGAEGKTFVVSHNPDASTFDAIAAGYQIASADQDFYSQATFGAQACADFLSAGTVLPDQNKGDIITAANVEAARQRFSEVVGK